jgi:hypothetical protein
MAGATSRQIMRTGPCSGSDVPNVVAHGLDDPGHFVPERDGQPGDGRKTRPIVRIGVTDAAGLDAQEHVAWSNRWYSYIGRFQGLAYLN